MKRTFVIGFLAALALCGAVFASRTTTTPVQANARAALLNVVVDIDRPPASINVLFGGTITLTKQGRVISNVQVTHFATDGRGELFIKMPGGPIGTVATLRPMRKGTGVIQIRQTPAPPGGRGFANITVFVH